MPSLPLNRSLLIGMLLSLFFTTNVFAQPPVINSFTPFSGNIGTAITITGSGFDPSPANNMVAFGSIKAVVTSASSNSLIVTVPAGAEYKPISVSTNGLTGFSAVPFLVTIPAGASLIPNAFEYSSFPYPPGEYVKPQSMAVADMDGDGKNDIGFFDAGTFPSLSDTISIFRNTTSNGSFSLASKFRIIINGPHEPIIIYFQDIDADGRPDIVALNPSGHFSIYRNSSSPGNLSFDSPVSVDLAGQHGYNAAFGDFDNDGKVDIAMTVSGDVLNIFKNSSLPGSININSSPVYSIAAFNSNFKTADIDGDNKIDIVTMSSTNAGNISILKNTSSGGAVSFVTTDLPTPGTAYNFLISDLDQDQKPDIFTISYSPSNYSVFRNTSTPGTLSFAPREDKPLGLSFSINDMDGDGKPDLLAGTAVDSIGIFKNTSSPGVISFAGNVNFATAPQPVFGTTPKLIYDMNNDGKPEIIATNSADFELSLSLVKNRIGEPRISSFDPKRAVGDTTINITGNNFSEVTVVNVGSNPAISFSIISPTQISAIVPAGSMGKVIIANPYGGDSLGFFNTPFINSFSPYLAGPGSPDTVVTINGYNFTGVTAVSFGGFSAASFTIVSDTEIKAIPGSYPIPLYSYITIAVTSAYGTGSKDNFVYASGISVELCPPASSSTLNSDVLVSGATYHWQLQVGNGNYNEVTDGVNYSGSQTNSLHLINVPSSQYGYRYRCALSYLGPQYPTVSTVFVLRFVNRWNGSASTAWEDPANWSCAAVPDANTDVVIISGATITLNSNSTIRSLYINPGATLTIGAGYNLTILH